MAVEKKVPRWESELWSYIGASDGVHCPFHSHCETRQSGKWCPDANRERLDQLLDSKQFNLNDYDFIGRGPCTGIIMQGVEMLTRRWLKKGGVNCPPVPIELVALAELEYPIEVRLVPLKVLHGATWCLKDGVVIQIRSDDPTAMQRITLFHEVFHLLCRHKCGYAFRAKRADKAPFLELVAHAFADFLLMPTKWLKEKWVEFKDLNRMAELFDVPKPAMCIRLKLLGLI